MTGTHFGEIAKSTGGFFFVWTIIALGVTALISVILSVRGLWSLRRTTPAMKIGFSWQPVCATGIDFTRPSALK
jgi:hypothetical protein